MTPFRKFKPRGRANLPQKSRNVPYLDIGKGQQTHLVLCLWMAAYKACACGKTADSELNTSPRQPRMRRRDAVLSSWFRV